MRDLTTLDGHTTGFASDQESAGVRLTLLWHRDLRRVGARAWSAWPVEGRSFDISRATPVFDDGAPLDDPHLSRSPLQLVAGPQGALHAWPTRDGQRFDVDGQPGWPGAAVRAQGRGAVLGLGRGAVVLVQQTGPLLPVGRHGLIGSSPQTEALIAAIDAAGERTTLLRGESGTGKEVIASALHRQGARRDRPFVAVNMAALIGPVAPSQLFGHARGAFTGAEGAQPGLFGEAHTGTLFLDEIGACATDVQAQLLRALESGEVQPVGGAVRRVDVRVIAATDADLDRAVAEGSFRAPLLHRLSRRVIVTPPLRDRPADIAAQAVAFVGRREADGSWFGREVMDALLAWRWPGNSRELRSVMEGLADQERLTPPVFSEPAPTLHAAAPAAASSLEDLLVQHDFRVAEVARALGMSVNTVRRRMEELDLPRPRDLDAPTIRAALHGGADVAAAARRLRVSEQGLRLRMAELGVSA